MEELYLKNGRSAYSRVGFAAVLNIAVTTALQFLLQWLFGRYLQNPWIMYAVLVLPIYLIAMPVSALLVWDMPLLPLIKKKLSAGRFIIVIMVCFAIMYASNWVGAGINLIIQAISGQPTSQDLLNLISGSGVWANLVFVVILAPVAEELFFRKLLIPRLLPFGEKPAIIISGLLFGLIHGNFSQFFYAFGLGIAFGFIFVKTGKVIYTIILHMIINFFGSVISLLIIDAPMVVTALYGVFVLCLFVTGLVLFFVNAKRTKMSRGLFSLAKGKAAVYCSPGMLLAFLCCAGLFALSVMPMFG